MLIADTCTVYVIVSLLVVHDRDPPICSIWRSIVTSVVFFVLLPARALKQCVIPTLSEVSYLDPALAVTDTVATGDPVSRVDTINPLDNFSVCGSREGASALGAA